MTKRLHRRDTFWLPLNHASSLIVMYSYASIDRQINDIFFPRKMYIVCIYIWNGGYHPFGNRGDILAVTIRLYRYKRFNNIFAILIKIFYIHC